MYGQPSDQPPLEWDWVDRQLTESGTYWVIARTAGHPHPRPVWGVWQENQLHLSIGGPTIARAVAVDPRVTVHLGSGTDVVIVEGLITPANSTAPALLDAYNRKYEWDYLVAKYGDFTRVLPSTVIAWRTSGWAGRDGFDKTGRWDFGARD
jgi:hypothetical protein